MKKTFLLILVALATLLMMSCESGGGKKGEMSLKEKAMKQTLVGYATDGEKIVFAMNEADYPSFEEIESITVAGEMNGWDPSAPDWQATDDDGDGIWILETTIAEIPCGTKFKFVSNEVDWNQPNVEKVTAEYGEQFLADDGFGGFNLVVVCE